MGFAVSSVAVRGRSLDDVLTMLGWRGNGDEEEFPESPAVCTILPSGWLVLVFQKVDATDGTIDLRRLSQGAEVVACFVEEHVMFSVATAWADGRQIWSVTHDSSQGVAHLEVTGQPPPAIEVLTGGLAEAQQHEEDVDLSFDVPVDLAESVTRYRYDRADTDGGGSLKFEVLEALPT